MFSLLLNTKTRSIRSINAAWTQPLHLLSLVYIFGLWLIHVCSEELCGTAERQIASEKVHHEVVNHYLAVMLMCEYEMKTKV